MSKMREAATVKTKNLGNYRQTLKAHNIEHKRVTMPSKEILLGVLGQGDGIEVTVKKTKGQKRTSPVANFNSGQKAEKERSTINDNKSPQNWGNIFGEQNLVHMTKERSTKHDKDREAKKNTSAKTQQSTAKNLDLKSSAVPKEPSKEMKTMYDLFMMEREKLQRELQNQIANQLKILNEICMKEGSTSPQMSFIHTGHACSSPTSTDDSSQSLDDISVSSVNSICEEHARRKDAPVEDPKLVSLLDGESSHTIMPDQNEVTNAKRSAMQNNTVPYQNMDTNNMIGKKSLRHSSKKGCKKENDTYKTRKFAKPMEKQNNNIRKLFLNTSKALESITSTKSTVSGIRKQGDVQNRKPVNIPSPLRNCPHPDWTDSSLPSISTVSNLDTMIPNDV
ncbi:uncharacterized protein LOC143903928 isoform X4 [Temnothorax americanus]|uniref:uncharacterized protein LOC143903928 isoform X4 n=1 Tax=Temnothorax americanus TaxID=1964332 RepID=UPI004067A287